MHEVCKDCLFGEAVEDETYLACQARQKLVMPFDKVCDFFEERGCICKECTMDKYINTTELPRVKILEQNEDDIIEYASMQGLKEVIKDMEEEYEEDTTPRKPEFFEYYIDSTCDCDCCNANSYPKEQDPVDMMWDDIMFMIEDLTADSEILLEKLGQIQTKESTTKDVLRAILGLEVDLALLKQLLIDLEE